MLFVIGRNRSTSDLVKFSKAVPAIQKKKNINVSRKYFSIFFCWLEHSSV